VKTIKEITVILLISIISTMPTLAQGNTKNKSDFTQESYKILFIGSSYFNFNNLPNLFNNLAGFSGKEVYIDQYIPGGLYLADHASSSITESKINEKDWDYVILQGGGSVTAYPDSFTTHPVYPALETLQNKIYQNCESTIMVFCLPWAFEDGMTWYGWSDTYADMQIKIYDNTLLYSNNLDFPIAPVGWTWYTVLEELNYPLHYLHMSDWNHPSLKGSYLMACVIFSTIFQESSVGNTYYANLPEQEANYFQTVASNTVLDSLELWNITRTNSEVEIFHLHQNYPNPFNPVTTIRYDLPRITEVTLTVYDILGKKVRTLICEKQSAGRKSVSWDGKDKNNRLVSTGVYVYRLTVGNNIQSRKMVKMIIN